MLECPNFSPIYLTNLLTFSLNFPMIITQQFESLIFFYRYWDPFAYLLIFSISSIYLYYPSLISQLSCIFFMAPYGDDDVKEIFPYLNGFLILLMSFSKIIIIVFYFTLLNYHNNSLISILNAITFIFGFLFLFFVIITN